LLTIPYRHLDIPSELPAAEIAARLAAVPDRMFGPAA
jgi:hypothetical protein